MNTLTTITGRKLRVAANHSKRTFTIKTDTATFRTTQMSKDDFESCLNNTRNDWNQFLKTDDYYKVR